MVCVTLKTPRVVSLASMSSVIVPPGHGASAGTGVASRRRSATGWDRSVADESAGPANATVERRATAILSFFMDAAFAQSLPGRQADDRRAAFPAPPKALSALR